MQENAAVNDRSRRMVSFLQPLCDTEERSDNQCVYVFARDRQPQSGFFGIYTKRQIECSTDAAIPSLKFRYSNAFFGWKRVRSRFEMFDDALVQ
jgi:hypothetical protein